MTYRGPARAARSLASSATVALVALIGGGCANGPTGTGSGAGANPATHGSPSTGPDSTAAGGTAGGGDQHALAGAAPDPAELRETLAAHARCMRENGVADFPDPGPDGSIQYQGDSDRPEFASASEKCDDLAPPPPRPNR